MDSINLFEAPAVYLNREAKRRKIILVCIFGLWALIMGSLISGAYVMKYAKEQRMKTLAKQVEILKPRLAEYENQRQKQEYEQNAQCAASTLNALFEVPIKGVHLSKLTVTDNWRIEGSSDYSHALDQYKQLIEIHLQSSQWIEQYASGRLSFQMQGQVAC